MVVQDQVVLQERQAAQAAQEQVGLQEHRAAQAHQDLQEQVGLAERQVLLVLRAPAERQV